MTLGPVAQVIALLVSSLSQARHPVGAGLKPVPATLSFELTDATDDYLYPLLALDNVSIDSTPPVPEPATLACLA
jgi:hypothetical protein